MDFEEYVAARRGTLVRVATLLGCPEAEAPALVAGVLLRSARHVDREEDPDPDVYRALVAAVRERRPTWDGATPHPPLPEDTARTAAGLAVRRRLASLPADQRDAVVLLQHADLTLGDAAFALRGRRRATADAAAAGGAALGPGVRSRLQAAADTVDVPPPEPLVRPPTRRRWPWLAAAAAATAAVTLAATAARGPDPPEDTLDADQIPSVFGYDDDEAAAVLQELGLVVSRRSVHVCAPRDKVFGTVPPTGTRFAPGDAVAIETAFPSGVDCQLHYRERSDAWAFLDFAAGHGPAPRFAETVHLAVDRGEHTLLGGPQARDPAQWGPRSALTVVAEALRAVTRDGNGWRTPDVTVERRVPPYTTCGVPRPPPRGEREVLSLTVWVSDRVTDPEPCPLTVDLYRTPDRAITGVMVYTRQETGG